MGDVDATWPEIRPLSEYTFPMIAKNIEYRRIFIGIPVAAIIASDRLMIDCNAAALRLFKAKRSDIVGNLFSVLYPSRSDFEAAGRRMEPLLAARVTQYDDRIMRRMDGSHFWVTVRGHAFNRKIPHKMTVWTFSEPADNEEHRQTDIQLTVRERDVAALLIDGLTSKEIAKSLGISPRTVDIHRANLLKKYAVHTTLDLIKILVQ